MHHPTILVTHTMNVYCFLCNLDVAMTVLKKLAFLELKVIPHVLLKLHFANFHNITK